MVNKNVKLMFFVLALVALAFYTTSALTIAPIGSKDFTFKATIPYDPDGKLPMEGGVFEFAPGCEKITINRPTLDIACAERALGARLGERVNIGAECTKVTATMPGGTFELKQGQSVPRSGYSLMLDEVSVQWVYGTFSDVSEGNTNVTVDKNKSAILAEFASSWRVIIEKDALLIVPNNGGFMFQKKLPNCVPAGAQLSDSPRILGATIIDNRDGTFTSVGNVKQSEINFPAASSGTFSILVSNELGDHAVVIKPFIEVRGDKVDFLPESVYRAKRTSANVVQPLTQEEINSQPVPSLLQQFIGFLKRLLHL